VADESLAGLLGMDARDARLKRALATWGFPLDLVALIERQQDAPRNAGVSTLDAPARAVRVTFMRSDDGSWCVYEITCGRGQPERPAHPALPLGLSFDQFRSDVVALLGEPTIRAVLGSHRWERDDLTLVLDYDRDGGVRRVHYVMSNQALRERVHGQGR
jgi:hypothetical protein